MATETISLGTDPGGTQFFPGGMGAFFKFGAAPSATMALLDLYSGSAYIRVSLKTDLTVFFEFNVGGWSVPNLTSSVLSTDVWYWISAGASPDGNQQTWSELYIHYGGGIASHPTGSNGVFHSGRVDVTGVFGVGTPLSSSYLGFPNASGWAWSKPRIKTVGPVAPESSPAGFKAGAFFEPSSDWTLGDVGSNGGGWNNREAVGSTGNLADISSNNTPLIPSAQGLTVILDGPYP